MEDPKPLQEWSDETLATRATRYEGLRVNKLEELELIELLLSPMRAEAARRGFTHTRWSSWQPKEPT